MRGDPNDTVFTSFPTCPHCGFMVEEDWYVKDSQELECHDCGKKYTVKVHTSTYYTTKKAKD